MGTAARRIRRAALAAGVAVGLLGAGGAAPVGPVGAQEGPVAVGDAAALAAALADPEVEAVALTADVTVGCDDLGPRSAVPLLLDGAGHTLSDACTELGAVTLTGGPFTLLDITVEGPRNPAGTVVYAPYTPTRLERATVVGHGADTAALSVGAGSEVVDSTIRAAGTAMEAGPDGADPVRVAGSSIEAVRTGIEIPGPTPLALDRSTVRAGWDAVSGAHVTLSTAGLSGGRTGLRARGQVVAVDSTLAAGAGRDPEPDGGALVLTGDDAARLSFVTLVSSDPAAPTAHPGLWADAGVTVDLLATVVAGGEGQPACSGGGTITSSGHNVAVDASCGLAGPGDRVGDPGLAPFAPDLGYAAPRAGSAVLDAVPVAACGPADGVDQRGVTRPQGRACDVGAIELAVVPGGPPTPTTPPSGPAPPATPIPGPARFTG